MTFRLKLNQLAKGAFLSATLFGVVVLIILMAQVTIDGIQWIDMQFITSHLSNTASKAGIMGPILGTLLLMVVVIVVTLSIGVGAAIYLELYAKNSRLNGFIQTNIRNLAGVPSIVYGILGLTIFARLMDLGNTVLAGGFTLSLLVLPIVIVASQEALRSVPNDISEASYGLGATTWQTIQRIILPTALPGILTGAILAVSRSIGETAPLVVLGIPALLIPFPNGFNDQFTALPLQIYYWTLDSVLVDEYANLAAATIIILMTILITLNLTAIIIRNKFQKHV
ncbi:phosphate ABC transporter permease PstA [Alkalibacillus flavidus]